MLLGSDSFCGRVPSPSYTGSPTSWALDFMTYQSRDIDAFRMSFNLRQHEHVLLSHGSTEEAERHELATSPLVTFDAYRRAASVFPQLAVFGSILEQNANGFDSTPSDCRLYMNTNTPLSAVVCGVQVHLPSLRESAVKA